MRYFAIVAFLLLALAPATLAQTQTSGAGNNQTQTNGAGDSGITLVNPLGAGTDLTTLLGEVLDFVVNIGAIVVILMIVFVGYKFVVARGNPAKITEARQALLWTVVGALILLGAKAIAIGICETTNALSTGGSITSCIF